MGRRQKTLQEMVRASGVLFSLYGKVRVLRRGANRSDFYFIAIALALLWMIEMGKRAQRPLAGACNTVPV